MTIADKICLIRHFKKWTMEKFANMIKVSRTSLYNWESGKFVPSFDVLVRIAEVAELELEDITKDDIELYLEIKKTPIK